MTLSLVKPQHMGDKNDRLMKFDDFKQQSQTFNK